MHTQTTFSSVLKANIDYLDRATLLTMPDTPYRQFYRWALTHANPQQEMWLQLIGLTQLVKMTYQLLGGLVSDEQMNALINDSLRMNGYQIFEIVSDNLGIGITYPHNTHLSSILTHFNTAMVTRLCGGTAEVVHKKLTSAYREVGELSAFQQSLVPDKHQLVAGLYLKQHPQATWEDIESGVLPSLIANIETCYQLYQDCDCLVGGGIVQEGLIARYTAVNTQIAMPNMTPQVRLNVAGDAILVMPTLAYYIAVIAERILKLPQFEAVIPTLKSALQGASVLVRLLNDLGNLTTQPMDKREQLLLTLRRHAKKYETLRECIIHASDDVSLTRLQKDARFGEFNVALHGIENEAPTDAIFQDFAERLAYFNLMYVQTYENMERDLDAIEARLNHTFVSAVVRRFVQFHVLLYSHSYSTDVGEYAI